MRYSNEILDVPASSKAACYFQRGAGGRSDRNGAETEPWFAVVKTRSGRSACACVRQPIIGA
ncbi:hypothetical protein D0U02_05345 [Burkholderia pseudomallei]|nr:hypothetical protein BOC51_22235 [Burkholderia pseudomallei]RFS53742.1 hypothetical protein D0U05_18595 [Burkholderia pseudomallei]RFS63178.1 hypothetical protein D0U01_20100 [Burkholderia pseudomallei]RFS65938.1 hypothetical protein D0U02_05345 [Burkholderia pseudomallei]RFS72817.1 hypothetical protein D0T98_19225 [Burkholderia pseudomallei]